MAAFVTNDYLSFESNMTAVGVDNSRAVENWAPFGVINLPNGIVAPCTSPMPFPSARVALSGNFTDWWRQTILG